MRPLRFSPALPRTPPFTAGDGVILLGVAALLFAGVRLAFHAPAVIKGPEISLSPAALPWYALLSLSRMTAAYCLSLVFSLVYGYAVARSRAARYVLMPLLDILQSVPILSFLPVALLGFSAVLPEDWAVELAAIMLIFTSQVWNMTFSFYQSLSTLPHELREATAVYRFSPWQRFKTLELPFAAIGLLWNSMMSWAGGWFFLMAAEIFHVGSRDFRLPGLGSYLQTAANQGDWPAVARGVGTLVFIIVVLDQCVWRPMIAWTDKFKVETVEDDDPPTSWFLNLISKAWLAGRFKALLWRPSGDWRARRRPSGPDRIIRPPEVAGDGRLSKTLILISGAFCLVVLYGGFRAATLLLTLPAASWKAVGVGLGATFLRVGISLMIALLWTIPTGVAIGTNRRLARFLQPLVQIVAAVPATALFPVLLLTLLHLAHGLDIAAVALMLMGAQWYLLFNVIAGTAAIPQDLRYTTDLLGLSPVERWRRLILPALFPYIITGAITASGGAWNASIVAEHTEFGGQTHAVAGIGALVARATATGDYALLLAATLALVVAVVIVNRVFWLRLYRVAEERYRLE